MQSLFCLLLCVLVSAQYNGTGGGSHSNNPHSSNTPGVPPGFQLKYIHLSTGIRMNYIEKPGSEPLVMVHGTGISWHAWDLVFPYLSNRWHIYAIAQRGHGLSDKPADGYTIDDFVADLKSFLDANNLRKVTLIGHSLGSLVSQRFAAVYPDRVCLLGLLATSPTLVGNPVVPELAQAVSTLEDPIPDEFINSLVAPPSEDAFIPPEFFDVVRQEGRLVPARVYKGVVAAFGVENRASDLQRITAPTVIFHGDHDAFIPPVEALKTSTLIRNTKVYFYHRGPDGAYPGHATHILMCEWPAQVVHDFESHKFNN